MLMVWDTSPPVLLAQTVYMVAVMLTVGVPLMTPSMNRRPEGSAGVMFHEDARPPVRVGESVAICTPRMSVMFSGLYSRLTAGSRTVMLMLVLTLPPLLLAQTV